MASASTVPSAARADGAAAAPSGRPRRGRGARGSREAGAPTSGDGSRRTGGGRRGRGRGAAAAEGAPARAKGGESGGLIRVSGTTPVSRLAGAIAHSLRAGLSCSVSAIGAAAVNQAVKGIITARAYLEEAGKDVEVTGRINNDVGRDAFVITVAAVPGRRTLPDQDAEAYKVGRSTAFFKLAGAIANRVREGKAKGDEPLLCVGIGANAVMSMLKASVSAAEYAEGDGHRIVVVPDRIVVPGATEDDDRTAMRLAIYDTST